MVLLSHLADRFGLWDYIAPPTTTNNTNTTAKEEEDENQQQQQQQQQKEQDLKLAQKIQLEENIRFQRIQKQYELESKAQQQGRNQFVKWQRVLYHSKIDDNLMIDAVVVGVHFDDGPDQPYYVSMYTYTYIILCCMYTFTRCAFFLSECFINVH